MGDFPSQVNVQPAIGIAGDFANVNPRWSVPAGASEFVSGAAGLTVGRFAWRDAVNTRALNNFGPGSVTGFIGRQGLRADITVYLQASSNVMIPGTFVGNIYNGGDFLVTNAGAAATAIGDTAYADSSDGSVTFGASPPTSATFTGTLAAIVLNVSAIKPNTGNTGSIAGQVMTISAIASGAVLGAGQTVAGTGVDPSTIITGQLSGTLGGVGTYSVNVSQTVASTTLNMSGGGLTITSLTSGTGAIVVGAGLSGGGITSGTKISALGTGTGGTGTYAVDIAQTVADTSTGVVAGGLLTAASALSGTLELNDSVTSSSNTGGIQISKFISGTGGLGTYRTNASTGAGDTAFTVLAGVATKWKAMSVAAPGELVTISDHLLG
jgi:hypothetical protein